jgi:hypothetical protein
MRYLLIKFLAWAFTRIGALFFPCMLTWGPDKEHPTKVVTFATSQRDINIAYRSYVEWLDEEYEKRQKKADVSRKTDASSIPS